MVAIKQAVPRLGNPQKQQGTGGKDHPALPQLFFPLPGKIIAVESKAFLPLPSPNVPFCIDVFGIVTSLLA